MQEKLPVAVPPAPDSAAKDVEFQKRIQDFNAELIPLLKKYSLGVGASAFLLPDGRIGAGPRLYDDTAKVADPVVATPPKPDGKLSEA